MTAATLGATKGRLIRCTVPGLTPNLAAILKAAERSAPRCGCFDAATAVMPWTPASNLQFIMYPAKALMQPRRLSPWTQSNQRSRRALPWVFDAATAVIAMDTRGGGSPGWARIPTLMRPRRLSPWTQEPDLHRRAWYVQTLMQPRRLSPWTLGSNAYCTALDSKL